MRTFRIASIFLITVLSIFTGFMVGKYEFFPYSIIASTVDEIEAFLKGDSDNNLSLRKKIANDLNIKPERFLFNYSVPHNSRDYKRVDLQHLRKRREQPQVFINNNHDGYYLVYGAFDFKKGMHGIVLLSSTGAVLHQWEFSEKDLQLNGDQETRQQLNTTIDAVNISKDGNVSTIFAYPGIAKQFDWCGKENWQLSGDQHHHSIEVDQSKGTAWTWRGWKPYDLSLLEVEVKTGAIVRTITIDDIMKSNPDIDILGIRQNDENQQWLFDPLHANDIDPMPKRLAQSFRQFNPGDLLISIRSLNLIFVLNPDTKKVEWWRSGQTRRQHDPDWEPDGTFSVFDNNKDRDVSRVIKIDPRNYKSKVILDGKAENTYSDVRGRHQILPNRNILLTSAQQGRVIEVDNHNNVVFEFINTYSDKENQQLEVTGAQWLPEDYFNFKELPQCND